MNHTILINYLKLALIIIGIIALGTLAINQTLGYYYKTKFLLTPCQLCEEINKNTKCNVLNPYAINMTGNFKLP
jgi:hypothetical protein